MSSLPRRLDGLAHGFRRVFAEIAADRAVEGQVHLGLLPVRGQYGDCGACAQSGAGGGAVDRGHDLGGVAVVRHVARLAITVRRASGRQARQRFGMDGQRHDGIGGAVDQLDRQGAVADSRGHLLQIGLEAVHLPRIGAQRRGGAASSPTPT